MRRLRTRRPLIAGALVAIVGVAAGIGIVHNETDHAYEHALHQTQLDRNEASEARARAVREGQLAHDTAIEAKAELASTDQQLFWMQQCFTMYPVPSSLDDPGWSHASTSRTMCVVDARKGVSPQSHLETHEP